MEWFYISNSIKFPVGQVGSEKATEYNSTASKHKLEPASS